MTAALAGWALLILAALTRPAWLIGPGSLTAQLLPGSQGFPGWEGIEALMVLCTLPVLVAIARRADR